MIAALRWFIWLWIAAQVSLNLASLFIAPVDLSSNAGFGDPFAVIELLTHPSAMLLHLGYLLGNLILALPAVAAAIWRDRLMARHP